MAFSLPSSFQEKEDIVVLFGREGWVGRESSHSVRHLDAVGVSHLFLVWASLSPSPGHTDCACRSAVDQVLLYENHLESLLTSHLAGPHTGMSNSKGPGWGQYFVFLSSSQVMLRLLREPPSSATRYTEAVTGSWATAGKARPLRHQDTWEAAGNGLAVSPLCGQVN